MSVDAIPFRSQFDIDGESAVSVALFGPDDPAPGKPDNDGGCQRIEKRRRSLGLGNRPSYPAGFDLDSAADDWLQPTARQVGLNQR